jgi:hypothetical protein
MDVRVKRLDDTEVVKECQTMAVSVGVSGVERRRKMAGDGGFEPPLPDPETGVLPLD